jgi:hypothetical protein
MSNRFIGGIEMRVLLEQTFCTLTRIMTKATDDRLGIQDFCTIPFAQNPSRFQSMLTDCTTATLQCVHWHVAYIFLWVARLN